MPQNDETAASGQPCDEPDCLACTIRQWIEANYPTGLNQDDKLKIMSTLAYAAGGFASLHGGLEAALVLQMAINDGRAAARSTRATTQH